jgi:hypothetical protein
VNKTPTSTATPDEPIPPITDGMNLSGNIYLSLVSAN